MDEDIDLDPVQPTTSRAYRKARDVVEHRSGIAWDLAVRGLPQARRADAALAMLEDKAVAPSLLKTRGVPPYSTLPLAAISCWWAEELVSGSPVKQARIKRALEGLDAVICFSRNQREIFQSAGVPAERVHPVPFGVDPTWFRPGTSRESSSVVRPQVLASGVDRGRDFTTLVNAAKLVPEISFTIVTTPGRVVDAPPNVKVQPPVPHEQHEILLQAADLVVVPTHELAYPTGQSVLLEGMACGNAVAVTRTAAMDEYINDGVFNLALPHADPEGVAGVISSAISDPDLLRRLGENARQQVLDQWNFHNTWRHVADVLRSLA